MRDWIHRRNAGRMTRSSISRERRNNEKMAQVGESHMTRRFLSAITILAIGILWCVRLHAAEPPIYVGVIEPWQANYVGERSTTPYVVRVAFKAERGVWSAMPHDAGEKAGGLFAVSRKFPEEIHFNVAFDGRNRGELKCRRRQQWESAGDIGLFQPDPKTPVVMVKEGASRFHYWQGPQPFRPLVAVSASNVGDPGGWKPWMPSPADVAKLVPDFRVAVGSVSFKCGGEGTLKYPDQAIKVASAYRSRGGSALLGLQIDPQRLKCDEMPDENWVNQWFAVTAAGHHFIGRDLELIDAGDYDGDGASEVVFHQSGYNYDGYVLLYDRLRKQAEFGWSYH